MALIEAVTSVRWLSTGVWESRLALESEDVAIAAGVALIALGSAVKAGPSAMWRQATTMPRPTWRALQETYGAGSLRSIRAFERTEMTYQGDRNA